MAKTQRTPTTRERLQRQNTPEARFMLRGMDIRDSRGGWPTATIEDGRIVFTYPNGTRTSGGRPLDS